MYNKSMNIEQEILELKERVAKLEQMLALGKEVHLAEKKEQYQTLSRDKTKYVFGGKIMPKNRLVFAVVKSFVDEKNPTIDQLKNAFDKTLQGSLGVFMMLADAEKISDGPKRFFMKPDEVITLCDNTKVVVCTQWGAFNINRFIYQAQKLGFEIEQI